MKYRLTVKYLGETKSCAFTGTKTEAAELVETIIRRAPRASVKLQTEKEYQQEIQDLANSLGESAQ